METTYHFKQNQSKLWDAFRGKELICGSYQCQNDAVTALSKWIEYNRLQEELLTKGIDIEKVAFKTYEQLLEIEATYNRYQHARKRLEATQNKVIESGKGKMFYGITGTEITSNYELGDYKTSFHTSQEITLFLVDDFCDTVTRTTKALTDFEQSKTQRP